MGNKYVALGLSAGITNPGGGVAGNNSNDATTFANRVNSITNGITDSRVAPGDTVRIMKSEDPVSLGINATFTDMSDTVTLASSLTQEIYSDGAWTASANVTCSTSSSTGRKQGSNCAVITVLSGFSTGMAAYYAIGSTLDLSGYSKISFWIYSGGSSISAGVLRIDLCSDAAGATPVNSFTINEPLENSCQHCITIDNGAALGASIQSIALYCISDPGIIAVYIDNVIACNALTLTSLISLSSSPTALDFWAIRSIEGTTVKLDAGPLWNLSLGTLRGFTGTTATATCYKREPIPMPGTTQTIQEAGAAFSHTKYSGGWDITDMSTQDGVTFIDMRNGQTEGIVMGNYHDLEYIAIVRARDSFTFSNSKTNAEIYKCASIAAAGRGLYATGCTGIVIRNCRIAQIYNNSAAVCEINGGIWRIEDTDILSCEKAAMQCMGSGIIRNCNILNNKEAVRLYAGLNAKFYNTTIKNNGGYALYYYSATYAGGTVEMIDGTISGNTSGLVQCSGGYKVVLRNVASTQTISINPSFPLARCEVYAYNGDAADNRIYEGNDSTPVITDETTPVHSPATKSWKHSPATNHIEKFPLVQYLSPVPGRVSGSLVFSVWVRRSSTGVGAKLICRGGQSSGIATDQSVSMTAAADTWELLSLTLTPLQAVPIEFELHSYRISSSGDVYFSDAKAVQA